MGIRGRWKATAGIAAAILIAGAAGLFHLRRPRETPAMRGRQVAEHLGCFACHGPGGSGGVANPGSDVDEVPAWNGGTAMMYVEREEEIREWILDGAPRRIREKRAKAAAPGDGKPKPILQMPAYAGKLSEAELTDLIAYYQAVAAYPGPPAGPARKGYEAAVRLGCFGCHGPGGRAGVSNPGSFKGCIPPWQGGDFEELVRDDDELRRWILDGGIPRLMANPLARHFIEGQIIQMPAYRDALKEGELAALVAYIRWLRKS